MSANNIRHLLVVDDSVLVGIVSARDLALASTIVGDSEPIASTMSRDVYTCGPETPLQQVAHEMERHRHDCAVIVDRGEAIGILTTTDALYALRWVLAGRPVARAMLPTHEVELSDARPRVDHFVRVSSSVQAHGAGPNPNTGQIHLGSH
jgi:acetoin utilization protein AcuB